MAKPTNEYMLNEWLKDKVFQGTTLVASHEIQLEFPRYARLIWGASLLPDTASRLWRKMRETMSYRNIGIDRVIEHKNDSKEMYWDLIRT